MGTKYKGSSREIGSLNAFINLMRAAESVSSRVRQRSSASRRAHLTTSQFGVLECLYHCGEMCQKALGKKILKSGGNMTTVIDNLEKRKLVTRMVDPNDRRFFCVSLTDKGERLIAQVFPQHVKVVVEEMAVLSALEQNRLRVLCRKLGTNLDDSSLFKK